MIHLQSNRTTGSYLFWVVYNFNWFDLAIESINYFFSAIWFWHSSLFAAWCKAVMAVVPFSACTAWLPHSLLLFWVCSLPPLTVKCFLPWNSETVISFITDCSIIAGVILCDVDLKSFDNKHTQMVLGFCKPFEGNLWDNIPCHIWKWYICYQIHDGIQTCIALPLLLVNLLLYLDPFSDWCYFLLSSCFFIWFAFRSFCSITCTSQKMWCIHEVITHYRNWQDYCPYLEASLDYCSDNIQMKLTIQWCCCCQSHQHLMLQHGKQQLWWIL